jgi:hypothetical protein
MRLHSFTGKMTTQKRSNLKRRGSGLRDWRLGREKRDQGLRDWGTRDWLRSGREGLDGARVSGQGFEEILYDRGKGRIALGCPDASTAVGVFGDGYGDVAHGFSGWQGFRGFVFSLLVCAKGG